MNSKELCYCAVAVISMVGLAAAMQAGVRREKPKELKEVTLAGRIVDVHSHMTGKYDSQNGVELTRKSFKAGIAAALETNRGLVILGHGTTAPQRDLATLAYQRVDAHGKLYERDGLRYLDMTAALRAIAEARPSKKKIASEDEDEDEEPDDSEEPDDEEPDEDPEEPEPVVTGACCVEGAECEELTFEGCVEAGGDYHEGQACDEVECP